jgi:chromate transporter
MNDSSSPPFAAGRGSAREVLLTFLRLGCHSFGGPIAHLGYFYTEFVERRRWCDEETFAELVGLAQSMPGPASSQVGFALGLLRAGWAGGVAAWVGFTTPSALLMLGFAMGHTLFTGKAGAGAVHGLQLVAVAVVAQAILSMRKSLAPDALRMGVALIAAAIAFLASPASGTVLAIATGALLGLLLPRPLQPGPPQSGSPQSYSPQPPVSRLHFGLPKLAGVVAAATFLGLLLLLPLAESFGSGQGGGLPDWLTQGTAVFSAFYRTGALVFGGGHVVLPLLENAVVARGWVDQSSFLAGYGAAQALPGPLFTFSAYLGAVIQPALHPVALSAVSLVAIFLPGLLVIVAVLPFWTSLRQRPQVQAILRGVNAAVVGVLISAFIRPVCSSALHSVYDVAVAVVALALLVRGKIAPWITVVAVASVSAIASAR